MTEARERWLRRGRTVVEACVRWLARGGRVARQRPFLSVLAVTTAAYLAPMWWSTYPKMLDHPAHIMMGQQAAEAVTAPDESDWRLMPFPWPNALLCAANGVLGAVLGPNVAGKLLVSLVVVSLPLSLAFLLRRSGLPVWGALMALPLVTPLLDMGMASFLASLPLVFLGIAISPSVSTWRRASGFAALSTLTFFVHLGGAVLLGPSAVLYALARAPARRWRTAFLAALAFGAPVLALTLTWLGSLPRSALTTTGVGAIVVPLAPLSKLYSVLTHHRWLTYLIEYRLLVVVTVVFLGALVFVPRRRLPASRVIPALSMVLVGFVLPRESGVGFLLGERAFVVSALAAVLVIPIEPVTRWRRVHLAVLVACMFGHAASRATSARDFDSQVHDLRSLAGAVPPGSEVLTELVSSPHADPARRLTTWPFHHMHDYLHLWRGTYSNMFPSAFPTTVVGAKPGRLDPLMAAMILPRLIMVSQEVRRIPFLLRIEREEPTAPWGVFEPVYRSGVVTLYRNPLHEQSGLTLPRVSDACEPVRALGQQEEVCCRLRLRWIDAHASCRAWGGELSSRAPPEAVDHWVDLSERGLPPGSLAASEALLRWERFAGARTRCLLADGVQGRFVPSDCEVRALALCERRPGRPWRPPARAQILTSNSGRYFLTEAIAPFDEAQSRCHERGARLVSLEDPAKVSEVLDLSLEPVWVDAVQRRVTGPWTTTGERMPSEAVLDRLQAKPEPLLCGSLSSSDYQLELRDCNALLPFCCQRAARWPAAPRGAR